MKSLAVAVNKGGVGKTMTCKTIATAAAAAGLNVLLLDMDTQQNSTKWGRRRAEFQKLDMPIVRFTTENDLADEIKKAEAAGCDLVVIDTPPGRSSEAPAAVDSVDLVIIPCIAEDVDSFDGIPKTAQARPYGWQARRRASQLRDARREMASGDRAGRNGSCRNPYGPGCYAPLQRASRRQSERADGTGIRTR